jgi:hypothetical protein
MEQILSQVSQSSSCLRALLRSWFSQSGRTPQDGCTYHLLDQGRGAVSERCQNLQHLQQTLLCSGCDPNFDRTYWSYARSIYNQVDGNCGASPASVSKFLTEHLRQGDFEKTLQRCIVCSVLQGKSGTQHQKAETSCQPHTYGDCPFFKDPRRCLRCTSREHLVRSCSRPNPSASCNTCWLPTECHVQANRVYGPGCSAEKYTFTVAYILLTMCPAPLQQLVWRDGVFSNFGRDTDPFLFLHQPLDSTSDKIRKFHHVFMWWFSLHCPGDRCSSS